MSHGHVRPNPDGSKARCGGPMFCSECAMEYARFNKKSDTKDPVTLQMRIVELEAKVSLLEIENENYEIALLDRSEKYKQFMESGLYDSVNKRKALEAKVDLLKSALEKYNEFFSHNIHWVPPVKRKELDAIKDVGRKALLGE